MRLVRWVVLVCLAAPLPALAGYDEGVAAYRTGDYATALVELRPLAEQGDAGAQWTLGLMYAQGSGVLQDYVQAHKWLNLAAARGHREAATTRESIARRMTPAQIAEAQAQARAYRPGPGTGGPGLPAAAPSRETVRRVQALLGAGGYDAGPADGLAGQRTRDAIRAYERDEGLPITGEPSAALLAHMEANPPGEGARDGYPSPGSWADRGRAPAPVPAPTRADPGDERVDALVAELRALVREGEAKGSADRAYLRALAGLADRYDDPWRRAVLVERFTSAADAKRNGWRVASGDFEVTKQGLRSRVRASQGSGKRSSEEQALALLGAIISQSGGGASFSGRAAPGAEIFLPVDLGEAFRLEVKLRSAWTPAHLEIGVYQGADRVQGYALAYRNPTQETSGGEASLELDRRTRNGSRAVGRRTGLAVLEDGGSHTLVWSRGRDGEMRVTLDGLLLMEARDRGIAGAFDGVRLHNLGGELTVRSLTLYADG